MVCVSGYKMVKEAIVTQDDNFVDRSHDPFSDRIYAGQSCPYISFVSILCIYIERTNKLFSLACLCADGLFQSNGEVWKRQRRFALSTLRNFGLGKNILEQKICEEARYLEEEIRSQKGDTKPQ